MLATTLGIIRSSLKADPSLTAADRTRLWDVLRRAQTTPNTEPTANTPRVISRKATAERLEKSVRFVDRLAQEGILKRIRLPGRRRAIGFAEADICALIRSGYQGKEGEL